MPSITISDKFQIVIPKAVRERLAFKQGEKLNASIVEDGVLLRKEATDIERFIGGQKDFWSKIDVAAYLEEERESWS